MTGDGGRDSGIWAPPGPGEWRLGGDHVPRALSPAYVEHCLPARNRATAAMFDRYGVPAETFEGAAVHGYLYNRLRPLVGAERGGAPPPSPILWVASRVHPEMRRRSHRMAETFATQRWRDDVRRWVETDRPALVATCQQLTVAGADPQLDDDGLALHLEAVTALVHRAVATHFDLKGLVALPLGDLLTLADGEGVPAGDVLDLLAGGSPASAMPDDVASRGCWLSAGYDLTAPTLAELSTGVAAEDHVAAPPTPDDTSALRAQLSPGARPAFDERLAEALLCYPVRDDSGGPTAQWPMGLLRRALLHAGGRLADRGELQDPADAIDLLPEEATASLRRQSRLDPDEIAVRRTVRAQQDRAEPPPVLGTPEPPPAADALPPPLRRCLKAMFAYLEALDGRSDDDPPARQEGLRGMGIAGATHTGRCVVARAPEDAFGLLEPGDVLVTWMTTPASLPLLGLAGAVVTEHGGPLSHAALVARETGITTVVGVAAATTALRTGDVVTVDPATGAVTPV